MSITRHTKIECTCGINGEPFWHDEGCPVHKARCQECEGNGGRWVTASCGCCTDFEDCSYCNRTGMTPMTDEEQDRG